MMCQSPSSSSSSSSPFSSLSSSSSSNSSERDTDSMEPLRLQLCSTLECSGISSRKIPDDEYEGLRVILLSWRSRKKRSAQPSSPPSWQSPPPTPPAAPPAPPSQPPAPPSSSPPECRGDRLGLGCSPYSLQFFP